MKLLNSQKINKEINENKRYWLSWQEAVVKFGPPKAEYASSVWDIYKKGIKKEKNGAIHLWSIILFILASLLFFDKSAARSLKAQIINEVNIGQQETLEDIEISYNPVEKNYFLAQIEWAKDWWEDLRVGRNKNKKITWLSIDKSPGEQAILSAKFIYLEGFDSPLVEVYGLTHAGHGYLHIYEIKNDVLNLLFETEAVDYNSDTRWAPKNFKKYGYGTCGEIFAGGKLASKYRDINKDGISDLILSGTKEIICEKEYGHLKAIYEIKADSVPIKRKILWDKNKHTWVDTMNDAPLY